LRTQQAAVPVLVVDIVGSEHFRVIAVVPSKE
jgi:hypothetical protein